jgi:hypothetical protein
MSTKFYRHPRTGLIQEGEVSEALARRTGLIEVGKDAKPLAFTPVPEVKIASLKSKKED